MSDDKNSETAFAVSYLLVEGLVPLRVELHDLFLERLKLGPRVFFGIWAVERADGLKPREQIVNSQVDGEQIALMAC